MGLYGVVAYSVSQRRAEIGLRMALGAQRHDVLSLILRQGMRPAVAGVLIGIAGSFAFSRLLRSLLFEIESSDPIAMGASPLLLITVTLIACWAPAYRASRAHPMEASRNE